MKTLYVCLILFLYYFSASGQIVFNQLPQDLQLFPRDSNSQAVVTISGRMDAPGYSKISLRMVREGKLTRVLSQPLDPTVSTSPFSLSATIKAELAEYSFQVFIYKGTDSSLVANPKRIVCGDVYLIHGQSNALAMADAELYYSFDFDDKFMRNVYYAYPGSTSYIAWSTAKQPFGSVGGVGMTILRQIVDNYGIPACVLNGAQGGADIDILSYRDPSNHANSFTFYGDLLNRAQLAGVARKIKAIIWKQGEADAGSGMAGYMEKFTTLYNQFREDYGNARIYVGQINILNIPQTSAAVLRDFQRRTKYLFNNVETIATVGTPGYDGVHYVGVANRQIAFEQFRQIARDFYGSKDTLQINSPDVRKVYYNTRKDTITLVFDDQMQMVWKNDTTFYNFETGEQLAVRQQKDVFYLDEKEGLLAGGFAIGNRVILGLKQPSSAKALRYLPAFFSDFASSFYDGPTLRNTRGMRAFSFDNVSIADPIAPVTTLTANALSESQIQLNWTTSANAQTQYLERADLTPTTFKQIAVLDGKTNTFTDTALPVLFGSYYYRLRTSSTTSESPYSNISNARFLILGVEPANPAVQVYPNPVASDQLLNVEAERMTFTELTMRDILGRTVKNWQGRAPNVLSISLENLDAGVYMADIQTADGQLLRRKVVVR